MLVDMVRDRLRQEARVRLIDRAQDLEYDGLLTSVNAQGVEISFPAQPTHTLYSQNTLRPYRSRRGITPNGRSRNFPLPPSGRLEPDAFVNPIRSGATNVAHWKRIGPGARNIRFVRDADTTLNHFQNEMRKS